MIAGLVIGAAVFYAGNWGYSLIFWSGASVTALLLGGGLILLALLIAALLAGWSRAAAVGLLVCLGALAIAGAVPRLLGLPLAFSSLGLFPSFAQLVDAARMSPMTFLLIGLAAGALIPRRRRGARSE
ncbi:hypothetical protein [Zhihengliuella sp.]|uniref:hypothetical protein n=1 Tax=Zhihengliuella sp. TaxID=1954483 RepID=UPI002810B685|nr:hypothetical protein [Zhihengliuella sp.]